MGTLLEYVLDVVTALIVLRALYAALRQLFRGSRLGASGPRGDQGANPFRPGGAPQPASGGQMARDPVCGMFVSTEVSHRLRRDGATVHFCSQECLEAYVKQESGVRS
ncbi:MAG TPA: hypothetical protein VGW33_11380 [Terriglobia bacterium]|nr:hypothetical protein [Terriglobia bacterium]